MILQQYLENARSQENNNADNYLKINSIKKKNNVVMQLVFSAITNAELK
jgi:hypothetical protein